MTDCSATEAVITGDEATVTSAVVSATKIEAIVASSAGEGETITSETEGEASIPAVTGSETTDPGATRRGNLYNANHG